MMWGGNSKKIFFHKDKNGNEQYDILSIYLDGKIQEIITNNSKCILQDAGNNGKLILLTSDMEKQENLYKYDLRKEELTKLTNYKTAVRHGVLSSEGTHISYSTNELDNPRNRDPYICKIDGTDKRKLHVGEKGKACVILDWSHDDESLLLADSSKNTIGGGIYDIREEEVNWIGSEKYEERPVSFIPNKKTFLAYRIKKAAWVPTLFKPNGSIKELNIKDGFTQFFRGGNGGEFISKKECVLTYTKPNNKKDICVYDLENHSYKTMVNAEYGNIDPERFVDAEYITYESADGVEIGALFYDSGERPSPAVVVLHGGPHDQSIKRFNIYAQFLVSRGYSVLQPNYRGSIGRGEEFKRMIHNDWGGKEQADIANGCRWLKDKEWISEDKVAIYGGSFGGYATYMQLVKYPELWAAGVASRGITDLIRLYKKKPLAILRRQMGHPKNNIELWKERSPLTYVDNIKRPILILHSVNDARIPVEQSRIFKEALEEKGWIKGKDFDYKEFEKEGHKTTKSQTKIKVFRELESFLKKHLKN